MSAYPTLPFAAILEIGAEHIKLLPPSARAGATRCLIRANNDIEAARAFLDRYRDSPNTYLAYEKEVERFVMWCVSVAHKGMRELDCDDINALFDFYQDPPPDWIANNRVRRHATGWRPFRGPLSGAGLKQARLVLRSLFDFLLEARYVDGNPVALVRNRRGSATRGVAGAARSQLTPGAASCCFEVIKQSMAVEEPRALRTQFIFVFYLMTGARRMELAETSVGDISLERGRWWMHIIGKGGKDAPLPIPPTVMDALSQLRRFHGLPPCPTPGEQRPLFARIHDLNKPISGNMVYRELKRLCAAAAALAIERGDVAAAEQLKRASTHWLRHTAIGRVVEKTRSLQLGQAVGRHASVTTTAGYATFEQDELHDRLVPVIESAFTDERTTKFETGHE